MNPGIGNEKDGSFKGRRLESKKIELSQFKMYLLLFQPGKWMTIFALLT